jgi:hypothetical protein
VREEDVAPGVGPRGARKQAEPPVVGANKVAALPEEPPTPAKREPAYAMWVVIAGLAAIVAVFVSSLVAFDTAADVTSATAGISGVIAALVGTYFGIRGSSLAQKQAGPPEEPAPGK